MSINHLIFRNLKKNLKNYTLYVFALIFSTSLYFAFVTLQFDPSMDEAKGTIKGGAAIRVASYLLVTIVSIFLLYANTIFIKRRSKEIGLFQLIGMTKGKIFRILSIENFILYSGSVILGIFGGLVGSKLILMILFKVTGVQSIAALQFSSQAVSQTLVVFGVIYLLIMLMNYRFIKRQSILSLFNVKAKTEEKVKKVSFVEITIGIVGILFIISGYYVSSQLFTSDFSTASEFFMAMSFILGSVIIGTYLFYKGSVSFIFNIVRKNKNGYLSINEVLSLSSIMFRMKSNSLLLTIITTVSALAIGLLSLTYISYYSAEKVAVSNVPSDFSLDNVQNADMVKETFTINHIDFTAHEIEVINASVNIKGILDSNAGPLALDINPTRLTMPIVSDRAIKGVDVTENEVLFSGYSSMLQELMQFKDSGMIELKGQTEVIPQTYLGLRDKTLLSSSFTNFNVPVVIIVDQTVYERLKKDSDPEDQPPSNTYIGIDINDKEKLEEANQLFSKLPIEDPTYSSQLQVKNDQKMSLGLIMFIVGFLGLTFLITSGCILYFKQMDESQEEMGNYTILRKLGFTQGDLIRGIQFKQLFNFGIPLIVGLLHSYFAVQSGWFLFGTEVWTPMIIVMVLYTGLYSIFGILSVLHYKKVIKDSL
ncbi:ABC transporter permease [Peribacillus psychrosaccharolyticus]|uniref:FtsX-like permease family protein n=1 Tax=Peribacillus psychrosaccharolyticus TaxID=1407 RepID=UPI003D2D4021